MTDSAGFPHFGNLTPFQNRVSAFATQERFLMRRAPGFTADPLHGYVWNYQLDAGDAVYGATTNFAEGPLDRMCDGRFVRVPYRRIPRIRVTSLAALEKLVRAIRLPDASLSVMWRGQTELYDLQRWRTEQDLLKFYGAIDLVEPSLLSSAARGKVDVEQYVDAWFGLLDVFINEAQTRASEELGRDAAARLVAAASEMRQDYQFREWAMGVAQHYGLPSTGLDLTPDLGVALFFALHRFARGADGATTISRVSSEAKPVIFLMSIFQNDLGIDRRTAPEHLLTPRALAQSAHFFRTAWGAAPNRAAERIVAVLDLVGHTNWSPVLPPSALFPSVTVDPFARFLSEASKRFAEIARIVPLGGVYFTR